MAHVERKPGQHDVLSRKLSSFGKMLKDDSLTKQAKILGNLLYKYRNQHGREKYFKCLAILKKCLLRWKTLALDNVLFNEADNLCTKHCPESSWQDVISTLKQGGMLLTKGIVLCQEAVQYSIGFLQLGFFINLHVTLFALMSRIWVLLKDCWSTVVESYRFVRRFLQSEPYLGLFPECLTLLLKDELKDVCTSSKTTKETDTNIKTIWENFNNEENGDDEEMSNSVKGDDIDLGEPVDATLRYSYNRGLLCSSSTPRLNGGPVIDLTKKLTVQFDMDMNDEKEAAVNPDVKVKNSAVEASRTLRGLSLKRSFRTKLDSRKSRLPFLRKIKRGSCTVKDLVATDSYCHFRTRKIRGLLAIVRHLLLSEDAFVCRKLLLRAKRALERELRRRASKRRLSTCAKKNCQREDGDRNLEFRAEVETPIDGIMEQGFATPEVQQNGGDLIRTIPKTARRGSNVGYRSATSTSSGEDELLVKEDDTFRTDEIDDIFSSFGVR